MLLIDTLKGVLGKVPGCPEDEAVNAMRDTAAEFCRDSRCWTHWETVTTTGTIGAIDMAVVVLDIIEAWMEETPISIFGQNDPELRCLGPRDVALTFEYPSVATLNPTPSAAVDVRVFRAFAPGPEATEVPDPIWLHYSQALRDGCLARLFAAPGKSWANPALASYHLTAFEAAKTAAAAEHSVNRRQTGRRLRVKPA